MNLMKKVPTPTKIPQLSDDDSGHRVHPVSYLGAEPDASSQTVVVRLLDPGNQMPSVFALSLPAAKQLSGLLDVAVEKNLTGLDDQGG